MNIHIRLIYLYLFSFIGLVITVIGCVRLVELGIKVYVFHDADMYTYMSQPFVKDPNQPNFSEADHKAQQELLEKQQREDNTRQRQREVAGAIAMILVGSPLYLYHWKTIQKDSKRQL